MVKTGRLFVPSYLTLLWFTVTESICPSTWLQSSTDQCFLYVPTANLTWPDASQYCQNKYGANLPVFRNVTDQSAYNVLMQANNISGVHFLGIQLVNGLWLWVDNMSLTFPYTPAPSGDGSCTVMAIVTPPAYNWNDYSCLSQQHSFCCHMPTIACPPGWNISATYQCYLYVNTSSYDWLGALSYCQSLGSQLPIFRSADEYNAYVALLPSYGMTNRRSYLGMSAANRISWLWVDGTPMTFTYWSPGEPNGQLGATGEMYGEIFGGSSNNFTWNDFEITTNYAPFCCQLYPDFYQPQTTTTTATTTTATTTNPTTITTTVTTTKPITTTNKSTTTSNTTLLLSSLLSPMNISMDFLADPMSLSTAIQDISPFLMSSLNDSMKKQMGQQKDDLVRVCTYDRNDCSNDSNFQYLYDPTYGNCYTFNSGTSPKYQVTDIGPDKGSLRILLRSSQEDYSCTSQSAGFRITLHENNLPCYPNSEGFNVPPGTVSTVIVEQWRLARLGKPYETCANSMFQNFNGSYTVKDCLNKCFQTFCVEKCSCADPRFPLLPGAQFCQLNSKNCLDNVNNCMFETVMNKCDCPPPCSEVEFSSTTTTVKINSVDIYKKSFCLSSTNVSQCEETFNENFAILYIYYRSLKFITFDEIPTYKFITLVYDFSGVVGLLLGISVISIPETLCFVFSVITLCCTKGKLHHNGKNG